MRKVTLDLDRAERARDDAQRALTAQAQLIADMAVREKFLRTQLCWGQS